jgi:hypothetical protein
MTPDAWVSDEGTVSMTMNGAMKTLAALLSFVLLTTSQSLYGFQSESPSGGEGSGGT